MKAIILAGGMGTRLGKYTNNLPKGMLRLAGKSLIGRQIDTLRSAGISDIVIVKGYMPEKIHFEGVTYYTNNDYADTNMVETLFTAEPELRGEVLVCYSDILYERRVIEEIIRSEADIGVVVDKDYWDYWQWRLDRPDEDMESLVLKDGKIVELGDTHCSRDKAKVRYVGLIKFSSKGVESLVKVYYEQKRLHFESSKPWMRSKSFKKAYMTCILQALIDEGHEVSPIIISKGWLEFDTTQDYEKVDAAMKNGDLAKFIKL